MTVCERGCWHASAPDGFGVGSFRSFVSVFQLIFSIEKLKSQKAEINSKFFNWFLKR
jgi:hypothetical protein